MRAFIVMTKNNLKLLIRSFAFILCLLILPFGASALLKLQKTDSYTIQENYIIDINHINSIAGGASNAAIILLDSAQDEESKLMADYLAKDSIFSIYRWNITAMTADELSDTFDKFHNHGFVTDVIYLSPDFGKDIANGKKPEIIACKGREDYRANVAEKKINSFISIMLNCQEQTSSEAQMLKESKTILDNMPKIENQIIQSEQVNELDEVQSDQLSAIGYSVAVLVLAFILSGAFIANLITTERENKTYMRISLSGVSMLTYTAAKAMTAVITAIIQTGVTALAMVLLDSKDIGVPFGTYIVFIGAVGVIFNLLSVTFGIYFRNSLTTIYSAVGVWMISNLFAKLYFSFLSDDAFPIWWEKGSLLTPQRWVMISSKAIMLNESGAVGLFFTAMAGFAIVIITAGVIGTKLNSAQE